MTCGTCRTDVLPVKWDISLISCCKLKAACVMQVSEAAVKYDHACKCKKHTVKKKHKTHFDQHINSHSPPSMQVEPLSQPVSTFCLEMRVSAMDVIFAAELSTSHHISVCG